MSDRPSARLTETQEAELARGKLRIATLEREAIEQSGNAATVLRAQVDRYQSLVLALAQIIWTRDPKGQMVGEQPSWAAYTGQDTEHQALANKVREVLGPEAEPREGSADVRHVSPSNGSPSNSQGQP